MRRLGFAVMLLTIAGPYLCGQEGDKLTSGPKAGAYMPSPFECLNVNGPSAGRQSCLVCRFALSPSVLIFAKEPAAGKDAAFTELLKQLDETATEFEYRNFCVGVVILSDDARDSTNNIGEKDPKKLQDETINREKLVERLKKRSTPLKNVLIACHPLDGPKKYDLNPKAEITVLFFERMKIKENWTFAPEALTEDAVKGIVTKLRDELPLTKKSGTK